MDQLSIGHPRWREFIDLLERRLDLRERGDQPGNYEWQPRVRHAKGWC
jgi:hypothetical protein